MNNLEESRTTKLGFNHKRYYSHIIIDATPEQVWKVLTDFESYPEWAVLFTKLEGDFRDGGAVEVTFMQDPDKNDKSNKYEHIIKVIDGELFSWSDPFMAGMVDYHVYKIEPYGNGQTKFIQTDDCKGGFSWLLSGQVDKFHEKYYPRYNRALKTEVERRYKSK